MLIMKREEILQYFNSSEKGLLVRTVQLDYLGANFENLDNSSFDSNPYCKKNWSIAHPDIKPIFYKMGKDVWVFPRYIAIMAIPSLIGWTKYLSISSKDACSNSRIYEDTKPLEPLTAMLLYNNVLTQLKNSTSTEQNQNSEVSTLGFDIKAFCGLLLYEKGNWWNENIRKIKDQLKILKDNYQIKEVNVYTYKDDDETGNKTKLTYKEKIEL